MKIIREGHRYELANFENADQDGQILQFIEKMPKASEPTELFTVKDGTTNEEVLAVLLDRLNHLQNKFPCSENENALDHLGKALWWLNERTFQRKLRNVEGKQIA